MPHASPSNLTPDAPEARVLKDVDATDGREKRPKMRRQEAYLEIASTCPVCGHSQQFPAAEVEQMCRLDVHHRCPLCKKLSTVDEWLFPATTKTESPPEA
jgi:hypothetical protein